MAGKYTETVLHMGSVTVMGIETEWSAGTGKVETSAYIAKTVSSVRKGDDAGGAYIASSAAYAESTNVVSAGTSRDITTGYVDSYLHGIVYIGLSVNYSYNLHPAGAGNGKRSVIVATVAPSY